MLFTFQRLSSGACRSDQECSVFVLDECSMFNVQRSLIIAELSIFSPNSSGATNCYPWYD